MKLLNLFLFGITYTRQVIATYDWNCETCGNLQDDDVRLHGDIFDNHFCKKCNNEAELIKDITVYYKIQLLSRKQFNSLNIFLIW